MPYVSVHIDEFEVLDEMRVEEIHKYLAARRKDNSGEALDEISLHKDVDAMVDDAARGLDVSHQIRMIALKHFCRVITTNPTITA